MRRHLSKDLVTWMELKLGGSGGRRDIYVADMRDELSEELLKRTPGVSSEEIAEVVFDHICAAFKKELGGRRHLCLRRPTGLPSHKLVVKRGLLVIAPYNPTRHCDDATGERDLTTCVDLVINRLCGEN